MLNKFIFDNLLLNIIQQINHLKEDTRNKGINPAYLKHLKLIKLHYWPIGLFD